MIFWRWLDASNNIGKNIEGWKEKPSLLAVEGACPPEDCGGSWGYEGLKEVSDKKHLEHKDMKEWLGLRPRDIWDAAAFDLMSFQENLKEHFKWL